MSVIDSTDVFLDGIVFPEGPRWHDDQLWFSDMHEQKVYRVGADGQKHVVAVLEDDMPSGLGFLDDGTLLVVSRRRKAILCLRPGSSTLDVFSDLSAYPIDSLNDMVTGGDGRSWVGARIDRGYAPESFRARDDGTTRSEYIVRVDPDGSSSIVADKMFGPNGSIVSADGTTLIVAESRHQRITAFSITPAGELTDRRVFADLGDDSPDGACLDEQGGVWFGVPLRSKFVRVDAGGEMTHTIPTPDRWAVACVLGGPDRRTLYLLTAYNTLENLEAIGKGAKSTAKGFIERIEVDVPGAGWP